MELIIIIAWIIIAKTSLDIAVYEKYTLRQIFCLHKWSLVSHNEQWKNKIYKCKKCKKLKDVWY